MKNMKNNAVKWIVTLCMMVCIVFITEEIICAEETKVGPYITEAKLISNQDIELYWSEAVTGASEPTNFTITVDGINNPIYDDYWYGMQITYYTPKSDWYPNNPDTPKTSIRLTNPISDVTNLPDIQVKVKGNKIKNTTGKYAAEQTVEVTQYDAFYQQEEVLDCGVKVLGTKNVRPEAMTKAKEMLEVMLSNETLANRMGGYGCMLGIFGEGEIAYDILEHRYTYEEAYLYVEGFGGTQLASIKDANVLRLTTGDYRTGYTNESILVHEFAHTVQWYGLDDKQQQEWENIYNTSVNKEGKWPNSYAGSNSSEYFATLSAMWFNAMDDTWNGEWDGVRGPINTRAELKAYDRLAYDFLATIYPENIYLPAPWENGTVPDNVTWSDGSEDDKENPDKEEPDKEETDKENPDNNTTEKEEDTKNDETMQTPPVDNTPVDTPINTPVEPAVKVKKAVIKSIKVKSGKKAVLTIKRVKEADGYKILYCKNAKFKKGIKTAYTKGSKVTVKKLKKGTWYFKVQAYALDSIGEKVFGKLSKVKKVRIK